MATYDPARATAWITEESGDPENEDPLIATGLFYGHVETDELPEGHEWGPEEPAPVGDMLAWARARATRVIVRVCGGDRGTLQYSAGEEPVVWDGEPLPEWPDDGVDLRRRRLPGWEHVDRTEADAPIEWDVVVHPLQAVGRPVASFGRAVAREMSRESDITVLEWAPLPGGGFTFEEEAGFTVFYGEGNPAAAVLLRLWARTVSGAERLANRALSDAKGPRRALAPFRDQAPAVEQRGPRVSDGLTRGRVEREARRWRRRASLAGATSTGPRHRRESPAGPVRASAVAAAAALANSRPEA